MKRSATALWKGSLKEGKGTLDSQSGVLKTTPYSFVSRFESGGETNPEELIAAAHSGCFAMALSGVLSGAGFTVEKLEAKADVSLENVADTGWTVTKSHLTLEAVVPGIEDSQFRELAEKAKATCPISRLLKAEVSLTATLIKPPVR